MHDLQEDPTTCGSESLNLTFLSVEERSLSRTLALDCGHSNTQKGMYATKTQRDSMHAHTYFGMHAGADGWVGSKHYCILKPLPTLQILSGG